MCVGKWPHECRQVSLQVYLSYSPLSDQRLLANDITFNGTLNAVNGEACLVVSGRPWVGTPGLSALAFLRFSTCRCLPFLLPSDGAAVF